MRVVLAHSKELGIRPPIEEFAGLYFRGRDWWQPPDDPAEETEADIDLEIDDLPDFSK